MVQAAAPALNPHTSDQHVHVLSAQHLISLSFGYELVAPDQSESKTAVSYRDMGAATCGNSGEPGANIGFRADTKPPARDVELRPLRLCGEQRLLT